MMVEFSSKPMSQHKEMKREERCRNKRKLCHDRKWHSNETSQDKLVVTKVFYVATNSQRMTKIKEGNMLQHFQSMLRHKVQSQHCKATRVCRDRKVL